MADKAGNISLAPASSSHNTKKDIISLIRDQLETKPLLLVETAAKESCSIFRIPDSLAEMNPEAYKPKVVSIGPYHYNEKHLQMIQEHKPRLLKLFLARAEKKGVEKNVLIEAVKKLENDVRISYSTNLCQTSEELVYMMILDGCFILMLLLIGSKVILIERGDPIFEIQWIHSSIRGDLLLLQNQVPLTVLKTLLKTSKIGISDDLNRMAFRFFNISKDEQRNFEAKHLLDLIRISFTPNLSSTDKSQTTSLSDSTSIIDINNEETSDLIVSAKRLRLRGIKFRLRCPADSILDIRLQKNRLQIPLLKMDEFISSIFLNCVAFEQFYSESTNDITSYVHFMGCLLKSEEDAAFLTNDKQIIENYFGSENEVSQFFKNICKGIDFDMSRSYLRNVFEGVNKYTSKWYNRVWAGFRHTHFESPWTCLSSFAVIFVILLTMLQATVAILSFLNDTKDDGNSAPP